MDQDGETRLSEKAVTIDTQQVDDQASSQVTRLTPEVPFPEAEGPIRVNEVYGTPWPLSEDDFLRVSCHAQQGVMDLSGEIQFRPCPRDKQRQVCFTRSYNNLAEQFGFFFHAHSDTTIANIALPPQAAGRTIASQFGARAAALMDYLDHRHYGVNLSAEDRHRIVLRLDCNIDAT